MFTRRLCPNVRLWVSVVTLLFAGPMTAAHAGEKKTDTQKDHELSRIGMSFEWARLRDVPARAAGLDEVETLLETFRKDDVPKERRGAVAFLSGEILFLRGDYQGAREHFEDARKGDRAYADDAEFAAIVALEAEGEDDEAAKSWGKWEERYPQSPLLGEVLLAKIWNSLRRDSLHLAEHSLARLHKNFAHMENDPRVPLTSATVAYLQGDPAGALETLGKSNENAAGTYLRALCLEATGAMLKAAAHYQNVIDRYTDSGLADFAMLAKANIFLKSSAYRSAAEEFGRVAEAASLPKIRAEAELRRAACVYLDGDPDGSVDLLRAVTARHRGTDVAARAQLLLGEVLVSQADYDDAIVEFNRVLSEYYEHDLAAGAQYRVGRCLDALERRHQATSAYQMVVSGYPQSPQSPAAAYLAGVGLLEQNLPNAAVPYFQLVLDRYAKDRGEGTIAFATVELQELVEASLCLLEYAYHRAGNLGQLSGVPHMMLQRMPPSKSHWRAWALLIDADALAAQARFDESQQVLRQLIDEFPKHEVGVPANRLLAWTYARQGEDELAIKTEERMLTRYAAQGDSENLASAFLNKAHILFNRKKYKDAAESYDEFLQRFSGHSQRLLGLYQAGLCHLRLGHDGDAVDRWEALVQADPSNELAERAWVRAGDVYFQTENYDDAKRCYAGLLENFADSRGAALGMLRIAQCDYNAGRDEEALEGFSNVVDRWEGTGIAREAERGIERALYRLGQREDGEEVLVQLVERFPNSKFAADAQFEIAMRRYESKDYAEAAEAFRRVITQFPGYSAADRAHYLMGDAYAQAGDANQARLAYEQFTKFFPDSEFDQIVRFKLGSMRFDDEDYLNAAIDFMTVLDSGADGEVGRAALLNLALAKKMLGEADEALEMLLRYRHENPKDEHATQIAHHLGDIYETSGRFEEAEKEFVKALNLDPEGIRTELYYRIGVCREQLEKDEDAIRAYRGAVRQKDKADAFRLSAVARLAAVYEKMENYKKAIAMYRDLIKNANDPELVLAAKERASQLEAFAQ